MLKLSTLFLANRILFCFDKNKNKDGSSIGVCAQLFTLHLLYKQTFNTKGTTSQMINT